MLPDRQIAKIGGGPRLRYLWVDNLPLSLDGADISQLRDLTIRSIQVETSSWGPHLRAALTSCPNLSHLSLSSITERPDSYRGMWTTAAPTPVAQLRLPQLETLSVHEIEDKVLSGVFEGLEVGKLSYLHISDVTDLQAGLVFKTCVGAGQDRGLIEIVLGVTNPKEVAIHVSSQEVRLRTSDHLGFPDVHISQLGADLYMPTGDGLVEGLAAVAMKISSTPATLYFERSLDLAPRADVSFLHQFTSLTTLHFSAKASAISALELLSSSHKSCPNLDLIKFHMRLEDDSDDTAALLDAVGSLLATRKNVSAVDKDGNKFVVDHEDV